MIKQKKWQIVIALMFFVIGIFAQSKSSQAISAELLDKLGKVSEIGNYNETVGGLAHVGVKIYWDDDLECYALDTYERTDYNYWLHIISDVNGYVSKITGHINPASLIHVYDVNDSYSRFKIRSSMIRNGRTDYSVITESYLKGKRSAKYYQITGVAAGEFGTSTNITGASFLHENTEVSGHGAESYSYVYHIYSARKITPEAEEISLEAHGGQMETEGKAYVYKDGGYVLTQLPTAVMTKEGYDCTLDGWYTSATGGGKYQVGDILQKGDVLHARWSTSPKKYNVTCIDVRGNDPNGTVLGQKSWQAEYGSEVTGASVGSNTVAGTYYSHCCYKSATKAKVTTAGATVYRYFSYETYPVTYVDRITSGTRIEEILKKETRQKEYSTTAAGSELGIDRAAGAYYEGYCYDGSTSAKVTGNGLTVYRNFVPLKYTIALDGNGAQEGTMTTTYDCEYDKEVTLKINRFQKKCTVILYADGEKKEEDVSQIVVKQKFLGWSKEKNGEVCFSDNETLKNVMKKEGTLTLYAVWSEETVSLPELPSKPGYSFLGWAKKADAGKGVKQMLISDSVELYAIWQKSIVKYHVEYYKENVAGEYELSSNYDFEGYVDDEVTAALNENVYQGYSLDTASSTLSGTIKADGSLILCAYYRRNSYSFSYDLNGGNLKSGELPEKSNIKFGADITITSCIPEREGYLFVGWCQENDNTHRLFQARESFVMQNHDVVMRAQWKQVSFSVVYDKNENTYMIAGISGEVPATEYIYQKDSYASEKVFCSEVGEVISWNTKPDGSGISVLPGANIKGMFDQCDELTLYAIWQPKVSESDVSFQLHLYQMENEEKKELKTLNLYGKAGEKVSVALMRIYQHELQNESVIYFYKGYEVVNTDMLEEVLSLNSDTELSIEVKERIYRVSFQSGNDGNGTEILANYQDKYCLPDTLGEGMTVERYEDELGNYYFPGEEIILEKNLQLKLQQAVYLYDELSEAKEEVVYVVRGDNLVLPERTKNGYRFLGWYDSFGNFVGRAGDMVKNITRRCEYYARWSEPLTYSINFETENTGVTILEGKVSHHQYTKDTFLPTKDQVVVPEGYLFEGWYDSKDTTKQLLTKISAFSYGDIILKPYLSKLGEQTGEKDDAEGTEDGKIKDDENTKNEDKKDDATKEEEEIKEDGKEENQEEIGGKEEDKQKEDSKLEEGEINQEDKQEEGSQGQIGNMEDSSSDNLTEEEENSSGVKKQQNTVSVYQKGDTFWKGKLKYKVLSVGAGNKRVMIVGVRKNAKCIKLPEKIVIAKISYKVTAIGKKAFYKSKKLVKITITSKKLSSIGKKAFAGLKKKGIIKVPKQKRKVYLKMLRTSGLSKKWKIRS